MKQLAVFAKYWEPGRVKTRLAATIGSAAASRLAQEFLRATLRRFSELAEQHTVVFAPTEYRDAFRRLAGSDWALEPQADGDLGRRLAHFFHTAFQNGARRVVVMGSDSPTLPARIVEDAFARLDEHDVVLGPADDGGYYLVGLAAGSAGGSLGIFERIAWSSGGVWQQTLDRVHALGLSWSALPRWYDIDTIADLSRLQDELSSLEPWEFWKPIREQLEQLPQLTSAQVDEDV